MSARHFVRNIILAGSLNVDDVFEQLYQSIVKEQNKYDVGCVFGDGQESSTSSQSSTSPPQMPLEVLTLHSDSLNTESKNYKRGKSVMSTDKTKNISLVHINEAPKTYTTLNGKPASSVKRQTYADQLHEEHHASSYHIHCSDTEYSYEKFDGYESGEVEEHRDKRYLCKQCNKLFKKARKSKHDAEKIPQKPAYSHWRCKYWMMMNRASSQKTNKRKKEKNRTLKSVVRKLRTNRCIAKTGLQCCRIHSFLKRNLLLHTKKKPFPNLNGRSKRKRKSAQQSFQTSTAKRNKSFSYTIEKKVTKKTYTLELDSSDEEETRLNVKRYKLLGDEMERSHFQKPRNNPLPMSDDVQPNSTWQEQYSPIQADVLDSPASQNNDNEPFNQRFNTNPQNTDSIFDVPDPSLSHVQGGSFKELLQRMNMGYFRSAIVRENRI